MCSNIFIVWLVAHEMTVYYCKWFKHKVDCVIFSSFGAMMKPFLDGMSVSPEGGHRLFEATSQSSIAQGAASHETSMAQGAASSTHDLHAMKHEAVMFKDDSVSARDKRNMCDGYHLWLVHVCLLSKPSKALLDRYTTSTELL